MQLVAVYLEEQHTTLDLDLYPRFFLSHEICQYNMDFTSKIIFFSYGKTVIIGFTLLIIPLRKVVFKCYICYDFRIKIIIDLQLISAIVHFVI